MKTDRSRPEDSEEVAGSAAVVDRPVALLWRNGDFSRLWAGLAVSQVGSAVGGVAMPIVAVTVLGASTFAVTLLTAVAAATTAVSALPLGRAVEFRRKRPVMVAADLLRFGSLASIPVAYAFDVLTIGQLALVTALNALGMIVFVSASQAHLVNLVGREELPEANGRLQSTNWIALSVGPSAGGALVGLLGAPVTLLVDAVSFLGSALAVWRIRTPEAAPPDREQHSSIRRQATAGIEFIAGHRSLRIQLISWILFAGCVGLSSPLTAVLYLRDLRFTAFEYGLIMGIPSLAGFLGSFLSGRLIGRFGLAPTIKWASLARCPWAFLPPVVMAGSLGVALATVSFAGVLLFSSIANSAMTTYRQKVTPDQLMTRVATAWSLATSVAQPLLIAVGGAVATVLGLRVTLAAAAAMMLVSAMLLVALPSVPNE
jgi:MFS family permease